MKGFSHEVRNTDMGADSNGISQEKNDKSDSPRKLPPAMYAHIDNGSEWAHVLFDRIFSREQAERFQGRRWAIINAWRPIKTIHRNPLGVCDTSTVPDADLVPVYAKLSPKWGNTIEDLSAQESQVLNVKANPNHRWYFASAMRPDEVLLLTIFDTNKTANGVPRRVVHSAFPCESEGAAAPRESIEFRALVVWEDQLAEDA